MSWDDHAAAVALAIQELQEAQTSLAVTKDRADEVQALLAASKEKADNAVNAVNDAIGDTNQSSGLQALGWAVGVRDEIPEMMGPLDTAVGQIPEMIGRLHQATEDLRLYREGF